MNPNLIIMMSEEDLDETVSTTATDLANTHINGVAEEPISDGQRILNLQQFDDFFSKN